MLAGVFGVGDSGVYDWVDARVALPRLNSLDIFFLALGGVCLVGGYGLWWVFRPMPPEILAVEPAAVPVGTPFVQVRGAHLRPYLRAMVGSERAIFALQDPSTGLLLLPPLTPGTYDLAFYDVSQEVARREGAVRVFEPAAPLSKATIALELLVRVVTRPESLSVLVPAPPAQNPPSLRSVNVLEKVFHDGTYAARLDGPKVIAHVWVRVAAVEEATGWTQAGDAQPLQVGAAYVLSSPGYILRGEILAIRSGKKTTERPSSQRDTERR